MTPVQKLLTIARTLRAEHRQLPMQQVEVFLLVAMEGPVSRTKIMRLADMEDSTSFRNLEALGEEEYRVGKMTRSGLGWISKRPAPNARGWQYSLTPKGSRILNQITTIMEAWHGCIRRRGEGYVFDVQDAVKVLEEGWFDTALAAHYVELHMIMARERNERLSDRRVVDRLGVLGTSWGV